MWPDDTTYLSRNRGDVNNAAPFASTHRRKESLGDKEAGLQVYINQLVPIALCDLLQSLLSSNPGIIHQDVDRPHRLFRFGGEPLNLAGHGNIGLNADTATSQPKYFRFDCLGFRCTGLEVENHVRTGRCQ